MNNQDSPSAACPRHRPEPDIMCGKCFVAWQESRRTTEALPNAASPRSADAPDALKVSNSIPLNPAPDSISTKLEELLLEFAEQVATDGVEDAGQFEREAVALYLPQFTALLHQYAQRQVVAELKLTLHDTGGESDARWTFENVKRRLAQLTQEQPHE